MINNREEAARRAEASTTNVPGACQAWTREKFNAPSAVVTAPNGDIFVADGHGGNTNARIVKFEKTGKFIKTWGHKGSGPGELDIPHAIAMDSQGRLFVGDRQNNRIEIFDQDGKYLDQWPQFSRPSIWDFQVSDKVLSPTIRRAHPQPAKTP